MTKREFTRLLALLLKTVDQLAQSAWPTPEPPPPAAPTPGARPDHQPYIRFADMSPCCGAHDDLAFRRRAAQATVPLTEVFSPADVARQLDRSRPGSWIRWRVRP
jgi:hypothetical protein